KALAEQVIADINAAGGDVLLVIGDTASADGDVLERCLDLFRFPGPKLFLAGNHDLWTAEPDSYSLFTESLPRRIRAIGWQWLETDPFVRDGWAIVGTIGWYDYSFAHAPLGIPERFYAAKVSPGTAERFDEYRHLLGDEALSDRARSFASRWNDAKFVKLHRSDQAFLAELLEKLDRRLQAIPPHTQILAATHHLPFRALLPPSRIPQWDFAHAYLGSEKLGELLLRYPAVKLALSGHSHFPAEATVGHIRAINIGSGYRAKSFRAFDL
ncbi:MAG TPA: metallophosphoesterase, partial [Tepidisphaeraceae bacterium]|nr:metallophosphoesterase [Tepidisphaeraceae bacterium]